ncbi:MAG: hypothetical protein LIP01_02350, partial [Tannerellaceae bacterium]|nr:hypothetical protein [Tannerellaceae bacterium]
MKQNSILQKIKTTVKASLIMFGITLFFIACKEETETPLPTPENETALILAIRIPGMLTRASAIDDTAIQRLDVLVFEKDEQDIYSFAYRKVAAAGEEGKYKITLAPTEQPVKLYLIANTSDYSALQTGTTPDEVTKALTSSFNEEGLEYIPMMGEMELESLTAGQALEPDDPVTLLRSIASVKVELKDGVNWDEKFRLKSIQVYRAHDKIQIIPDKEHIGTNESGNRIVTAPSIPTGSNHTVTTRAIESGENTEVSALSGLYFPEAKAYTDNDDIRTEATCLIIGGIYLGTNPANTQITYYRVDLKKGTKYGEVLRNNLYRILIEDVTGEGTTHPEEEDNSVHIDFSVLYT